MANTEMRFTITDEGFDPVKVGKDEDGDIVLSDDDGDPLVMSPDMAKEMMKAIDTLLDN